jgi:hypothetical protein
MPNPYLLTDAAPKGPKGMTKDSVGRVNNAAVPRIAKIEASAATNTKTIRFQIGIPRSRRFSLIPGRFSSLPLLFQN